MGMLNKHSDKHSLVPVKEKSWKAWLGESSPLESRAKVVNEEKLQLANFIKTYFDFGYYLGFSPFRFVQEESTKLYRIKTWRPQQVFCAVLHLFCVIVLISGIRQSLPDTKTALSSNPTPYFNLVMSFCMFFYKTVTIKRVWMNKGDYANVLNTIVKTEHLPNNQINLTSKTFCFYLCGFNVIQILVYFFGGYSFVHPSWDWSPSWWFQRLIAWGRFVFSMRSELRSDEVPAEIHFGDVMLALLAMAAYFARTVAAFFCDLILLISSLTLWSTASSLASEIRNRLRDEQDRKSFIVKPSISSNAHNSGVIGLRRDWAWIYRNFQGIQSLSLAITSALGTQVTWYMAEGLMYYSVNMNAFLLTDDWYKKVNLATFYATTFVILYVSADICIQISAIKLWLSKDDNIHHIPPPEANLVLHEFLAREIGLRGGETFTVTFPLVGTFLSLIITFFIICIQQTETEVLSTSIKEES